MSASTVGALVRAKVTAKTGTWCPDCGDYATRFKLELLLIGHQGGRIGADALICPTCALNKDLSSDEVCLASLKVPVRVQDVMEVGAVSRRRSIVKKARCQEEAGAASIGGRRVAASGSGPVKGDFRNQAWTGDSKGTSGKRYVLDKRTYAKIAAEAAETGRRGVLHIRVDGVDLAVMSWSDYSEAVDRQDD